MIENYVAWKMADGEIMAGEIVSLAANPYRPAAFIRVRRVDGTTVLVERAITRPATQYDIDEAFSFYTTPGPTWKSLRERRADLAAKKPPEQSHAS